MHQKLHPFALSRTSDFKSNNKKIYQRVSTPTRDASRPPANPVRCLVISNDVTILLICLLVD